VRLHRHFLPGIEKKLNFSRPVSKDEAVTSAIPMPPRLLSLLSLIESVLCEQGLSGVLMRSVNYRKGVARMTFAEGGAIGVQNFQMADGQLCLRVDVKRGGGTEGADVFIYPCAAAFDWSEAAGRVAREWERLAPTIP
jgi:hypothetical protein